MKLRFTLVALSALALASCSSDYYLGTINDEPIDPNQDLTPVAFGSKAGALTRASHEQSAALLNNNFVVFGEKFKGAESTPLFDNYNVNYTAGSAGTSESNDHDWEYVGLTSKKGATQGIRYWDFSSDKYQFVAAAGIASTETIKNTTDGMRIKVTDANQLTSLYVSDRVTATPVAKAKTATTPATIGYKETVEMQFRRLGAQMRIGFYETVPGYAVKDLIFYYIDAPSGSSVSGVGCAFPTSGTYTVTYDNATNEAHTKFAGAANAMAFSNTFGKLDYTSAPSQAGVAGKPYMDASGQPVATPVNKFLGVASSQATYGKGTYTIDGTPGVISDYKPILPFENNTLKMQLRLDYTLVALDGSGEEIHVRDAYVSVPVKYLKWEPNHSYTYIFKISDKSNGYTGEGGGGTIDPTTGGREPDPDNGGGDNDPEVDGGTGEIIPPYIPDPSYPDVPNPDYDPDQPSGPDNPTVIPDPDAPIIPNPNYPTGPEGDQHDPSNPVPDPTDPGDPTQPDPYNPSELFPITFDAVVVDELEEKMETITTIETPSITTYSATSNVTANNEYKKGEVITISTADNVTPTAWDYAFSATAITEGNAKVTITSWTSLGTAATATLTPATEGYYVIRLTTATGAVGYKVVKVVN